jgi:hypothetical protein
VCCVRGTRWGGGRSAWRACSCCSIAGVIASLLVLVQAVTDKLQAITAMVEGNALLYNMPGELRLLLGGMLWSELSSVLQLHQPVTAQLLLMPGLWLPSCCCWATCVSHTWAR